MLGSTGALIAGVLSATVLAAPPAGADSRDHRSHAEYRGAVIAADRAARRGIDWADCPAGWGLEKPIQCGRVTVPLDYARPYGRQIEIAVDRVAATGTAAEHQGALVYNPGGPGGSGLRFPRRVVTRNAIWANTARAYDFVGFDPRGVGHSAPSPASTRPSSSRVPSPTRSPTPRPTSVPSASSPPSTPPDAPRRAATCCRT